MTSTVARKFDVSLSDIIAQIFAPDHIKQLIGRMLAWEEQENDVPRPLRRLILREYKDEFTTSLSVSVTSGNWSPSPAYKLLTSKPRGGYRELSFPCLIDAIVGRLIIDALEPHITHDDNERAFFGRSNANANRERGDYESWYKVWLDYSSKIGTALIHNGFTYVFTTDVAQFFPSVDRAKAKSALAQRTRAHHTLLELLFYCLEAWCPRVRFCPVPGLPIEPNDISRLVAHNYLKCVDDQFLDSDTLHYLRWVDDSVVFVRDKCSAEDVKRRHHLALREVGLSPNEGKTSIVDSDSFEAGRHQSFNRRIDEIAETRDEAGLIEAVTEWYARDRTTTTDWDKVAKRLYTTARRLRSDTLVSRVLDDIGSHPRLQAPALKYLQFFEVDATRLGELLRISGAPDASVQTRMEIARFFCDARLSCDAGLLVQSAFGEINRTDERWGSGYAKALFLLCLNKYGDKVARDRVRETLTMEVDPKNWTASGAGIR